MSQSLLKRFSRIHPWCLFAVETQHIIYRDKLSRATMPLEAMLTRLSSFRYLTMACRNGLFIGSD